MSFIKEGESLIHLNIPTALTDTFRVLPKWCRKFQPEKYGNLMFAIKFGMRQYPQGFRVFRQRTYEWYDPMNIEVAKVADKKKWEAI